MIDEIVVRIEEDALALVVRWQGGDHTSLNVRKNRTGEHRWSVDTDVVELVTVLVSIRRVVESSESVVIQGWWPDSQRGHHHVDDAEPRALRPQQASLSE